jgi:GAF domain-containing protein
VQYPAEFVEQLLSLARLESGDRSLHALLQRVADLAVDQLEGCDLAGVTLVDGEKPTTAVFTDAEAPEIDTAQYETGRGPCVDAYRTGEILQIHDTLTETRWPEFAAAAAEHGVRSTLSLPLHTDDSILGALNLYARTVSAFDGNDQIVSVFVAHAATSLANSHAYWAAQTLSEQLQEALESRAVIEQAKGILIAEHACDADAAFEMLRTRSQHENRKLRDVAAGIVATAVGGSGVADARG